MTDNPLDDAIADLDRRAKLDAQAATAQEQAATVRKQQMCARIRDFVGRMNRLGNPGIDFEGPREGRRGPRPRGWTLTYETYDHWRRIDVTTDGRIRVQRGKNISYVPPEHGDFAPDQEQLDELTRSMAETLRRHS